MMRKLFPFRASKQKKTASGPQTDGEVSGSSAMDVEGAEILKPAPVLEIGAQQGTTAFVMKDGIWTLGPYKVGEELGKGAQGTVLLGEDLATGEKVALKIIAFKNDSKVARQRRHVEDEVRCMAASIHPNVLALKAYFPSVLMPAGGLSAISSSCSSVGSADTNSLSAMTDGFSATLSPPRPPAGEGDLPSDYKEVMVIVTELAPGGELLPLLLHGGAVPENIARTYFIQMAKALQHCHSKGIYHRDIKPENLLLDGTFQLKLADFGLSAIRQHAESDGNTPFEAMCRTFCGTRGYMAPEVLAGHKYDAAKADAWSAGVCLFILLAGSPPMRIADSSDWWYRAIRLNRHDRFWQVHLRLLPHFPQGAQSLLNRIFVADPRERATLAEVLSDPWLKEGEMSTKLLAVEMRQRKGKADAIEEDTRRQQLDKKRKLAKQITNKGKVASFDPFAQDVRRSLPGLKAPDLKLRSSALPAPTGGFYLIDPSDPATYLDRLHEAAVGAAGPGGKVTVNANEFEIVVEGGVAVASAVPVDAILDVDQDPPMESLVHSCEPAAVALRLYTAHLDGSIVAYVEVYRLMGDIFSALHVLEGVKQAFGCSASPIRDDTSSDAAEEPTLTAEADLI